MSSIFVELGFRTRWKMKVSFVISRVIDDEKWFDVDEEVNAAFQDADDALLAADTAGQSAHVRHVTVHFRK